MPRTTCSALMRSKAGSGASWGKEEGREEIEREREREEREESRARVQGERACGWRLRAEALMKRARESERARESRHGVAIAKRARASENKLILPCLVFTSSSGLVVEADI